MIRSMQNGVQWLRLGTSYVRSLTLLTVSSRALLWTVLPESTGWAANLEAAGRRTACAYTVSRCDRLPSLRASRSGVPWQTMLSWHTMLSCSRGSIPLIGCTSARDDRGHARNARDAHPEATLGRSFIRYCVLCNMDGVHMHPRDTIKKERWCFNEHVIISSSRAWVWQPSIRCGARLQRRAGATREWCKS